MASTTSSTSSKSSSNRADTDSQDKVRVPSTGGSRSKSNLRITFGVEECQVTDRQSAFSRLVYPAGCTDPRDFDLRTKNSYSTQLMPRYRKETFVTKRSPIDLPKAPVISTPGSKAGTSDIQIVSTRSRAASSDIEIVSASGSDIRTEQTSPVYSQTGAEVRDIVQQCQGLKTPPLPPAGQEKGAAGAAGIQALIDASRGLTETETTRDPGSSQDTGIPLILECFSKKNNSVTISKVKEVDPPTVSAESVTDTPAAAFLKRKGAENARRNNRFVRLSARCHTQHLFIEEILALVQEGDKRCCSEAKIVCRVHPQHPDELPLPVPALDPLN